MENICCVCLEETQKVTKCNHHLCTSCYSKMYEKKCPLCRENIKNSYSMNIKKVILVTEEESPASRFNKYSYDQQQEIRKRLNEINDLAITQNEQHEFTRKRLQEMNDLRRNNL